MAQAHPRGLSSAPVQGVVMAWVDAETGMGSDPSCEGSIQMPFRAGYQPLPGPGCNPVLSEEGLKDGANRVMDTIRGWLQ